MAIDFSRRLIKGRIAEVIFEQMIREEKRYTVIPFGYEHTMPTLAQYRNLVKIQRVIDNISNAPDFALISEDKANIYLVEVKYQSKLNVEELKKYAEKLSKRWEYTWLFVATPEGFHCGLCKTILEKNRIGDLSEKWVAKERQTEYLKLLNQFEK
ncbi:MAG: hypothetical protein Q7K28_01155 [Candidatus Wildermuthbacteria bacterium]|nr:hypothetical protein [Candidatus Wildermuthbacteria bacterium]